VGQIHEPIVIWPLPYGNGAELQLTKSYLGIVANELNPLLAERGIELKLHTDDMAKRFWAGAWGKLSLMRSILAETLRERLESPPLPNSIIAANEFAAAWRTFAPNHPLKFNPFSRADPPTLGEIAQARSDNRAAIQTERELPKAPRGKGAWMWM
jgi:hypothetical protein